MSFEKMPEGFEDLVKAVMKEPVPRARGSEIWDKFVRVVLMGGQRYDTEITFLVSMLKSTKLLDIDYVNSISGEKWRDETESFLTQRLERISDEESIEIINSVLKELFRLSASIKGSARFFRDKKIIENIDNLTENREKTSSLIEEIVNSEDVSGVKYTKAIMWLHSIGRGHDFAPPSRHIKDFLNNDIGPYYKFYEDDKYFMQRAVEFSAELKIKNSKVMDIARAIFFYRTTKSMLPSRSKQSKAFTPAMLLKFMKASKLTFSNISETLCDADKKYKFMERLNDFVDRRT